MRKLLILYLSCGAGHRQAALAIRESAERDGAWDQSECVDLESFYALWFRIIYHDSYLAAVRHMPGLIDRLWKNPPTYNGRETWTFPPSIIRSGASRFFEFIESFHPTTVVSTELAGAELLALMPDLERRKFLSLAVFVDFGAIDPAWIKGSIDLYCVPTEHEAHLASHMGVERRRIIVTGIPVGRRFRESRLLADPAKLGLPAHKPVVLFMAGGMTGRLIKNAILRSLDTVDATHVALAGANRRDATELRAIRHDNLRVMEWTDNMVEWMSVANVLVSKAGGMTLAEAFTMQTPLVLFGPLGWWERANMRFAVDNGAALAADSVNELPDLINRVLGNPAMAREMTRSGRKLVSPEASDSIAALISTKEMHALAK
jgi:processive 1,2-diacylglycerol beta-glucosyltransferase